MLKKGIKAAFCLIVLTLFCFTPAVSMAGTKVGYINLQKLVQESELGKSALREIEVLKKTKQMEISQKMKQINEVKIDLETRSDDLSEQDKKDRIDILNDSIKDYKRMVADAKEDIARAERETLADVLKKADGVLKKVAEKRRFTIILKDPNVIGYLDESVDITDEVIKTLNK